MALRVLLADESVTIKKVLQLALQDYAAVVSSVTVGVDVLQAATQFKPDIIFVDVILQKKNGYEVCRELKSNPAFRSVPVVLVWSGFMELDQEKYKSSLADDNLEKPFDSAKLHQLVKKLVHKTQSNPLSDFVTLPRLPDFEESDLRRQPTHVPPKVKPAPAAPGLAADPVPADSWSMDNFAPLQTPLDADEPQDDFLPVDLPSEPPRPPQISMPSSQLIQNDPDDEAEWVQKTLSKYKLDPVKKVETPAKAKLKEPSQLVNPESFVSNAWGRPKTEPGVMDPASAEDSGLFELDLTRDPHDELEGEPSPTMAKKNPTPTAEKKSIPAVPLSEEEITEIIRAQSKEVIEKIVWQVLPDVAARIIERELERLINERSQL